MGGAGIHLVHIDDLTAPPASHRVSEHDRLLIDRRAEEPSRPGACLCEKEIRPVAWEYDREATWPQAIIDRAHAIGLNTHVPEEYGGPGLSALDGCLIEVSSLRTRKAEMPRWPASGSVLA
jgi:hypothetical protein